jgi:Heterokaryon incompatibility protein (HET)
MADTTLKYEELDLGRNEIRLITILGLRALTSSLNLIECYLENVSLDDYSPEYAIFLELDGSWRSASSRSVLWDHIRWGEMSTEEAKRLLPGILRETVLTFVDKPVYHEPGRYNDHTTRWKWGDYDALSYAWGDPTITGEIIVNGTRVSVTKNLEEALRNLHKRGQHGSRTRIWIDALCINQKDIDERNAQVKRMKHIFAEAGNVYIWSGPELELGKGLGKIISMVEREALGFPETFWEAGGWIPRLYSDSTMKAIIELMSRPYWSRLWIIQEILLSNPGVTIHFGDQECTLAAWFSTLNLLRANMTKFPVDFFTDWNAKTFGNMESFLLSMSHMERLYALTQFKYANLIRPDLMRLLEAGRYAQQLDSRDKIYALLGLMDTSIQDLVVPDYRAPVLEIYRDFSRAVIKATCNLDIIFQGASNIIRNELFPSWVADWSLAIALDPVPSLYPKYACAALDARHDHEFVDNENHLVCKGFKVDAIGGLGCDGGIIPHVIHNVIPASNHITNPNVYKDDEGVIKALWEAFTFGNMAELNPHTATICRALPWLNGAAVDLKIPHFASIDRFQQCNQGLAVAGKPLSHYFPPLTGELNMPTVDPNIDIAFPSLLVPLHLRRFMTTTKGYVGFVPKRSQANDVIFILMGCNLPVVLRPYENSLYKLVGECYVHGIMKGEAMEGLDNSEYKLETVVIC